jgi:outer membrane protein OmpA-like peptidoglycan-associated protein
MRRLLAVLVIVAAPVLAQERTLEIAGEALDIDLPAKDLMPEVRDLAAPVLPLVLPVQEMIKVTTAAREVKIELPADVLFDFDKSDIRPDAAVALAAAADLLRKGVNGAVKIDGHTDSKGAVAYNRCR